MSLNSSYCHIKKLTVFKLHLIGKLNEKPKQYVIKIIQNSAKKTQYHVVDHLIVFYLYWHPNPELYGGDIS